MHTCIAQAQVLICTQDLLRKEELHTFCGFKQARLHTSTPGPKDANTVMEWLVLTSAESGMKTAAEKAEILRGSNGNVGHQRTSNYPAGPDKSLLAQDTIR